MIIQTIVFNRGEPEYFHYESGGLASLQRALQTGWIALRPVMPMVSSLTKQVMVDSDGQPLFEKPGELSLFNASIFVAIREVKAAPTLDNT